MLQIRRVFLPTDYSETAQLAVARRFADAHGAELHVLYARVPGDDVNCPTDPDSEAWLGGPARNVVPAEREGDSVAGVILGYADEVDADLVVMTTHGWTGLKHFLLGSVTEKVVRHAPCSVFRVHSFGRSLLPAA